VGARVVVVVVVGVPVEEAVGSESTPEPLLKRLKATPALVIEAEPSGNKLKRIEGLLRKIQETT
jgi:hypothetical protein